VINDVRSSIKGNEVSGAYAMEHAEERLLLQSLDSHFWRGIVLGKQLSNTRIHLVTCPKRVRH